MKDINAFLQERKTKEQIKEFKEEIADYLKSNFIPSETPKKDQFEAWFDGYLKNYIFKNGVDLNSDTEFKEDLLHKIDYLNSAQAKKRFDRMTWDVLEKQVEQWDNFLKKRAENGDDPNGTLLACQLSNQWSAVELTTDKALSYEGGVMGHCVGSYASKVASGTTKIYSIRDKKEQSHMTVEYNREKGQIVQVQGKENKLPPEKYNTYLFEFAKEKQLTFDSSLFKKFGIKQLGFEFIPYGEDYQRRLKEVVSDPLLCQQGGVLDLKGEKCDGISITGQWDSIYIDSQTRLEELKDIKANNITVDGCSDHLKMSNVDVNRLEVSNALFSDLSETFVREDLALDNTMVKTIPEYKLQTLKCRSQGALSHLESCHANAQELDIQNAPQLSKINKQHYKKLTLSNTGVSDLSGISADDMEIRDCPVESLEEIRCQNGYFNNINVRSISDINHDNKGSLKFENCPSLEKVSDVKAPYLNLRINHNPALKEVSGVNTGSLDLRGNKNLEKMEKIRVHRANLEGIDFDKVRARRLNIRKINTTDKELLRTRKIGAAQRLG